MNQWKIWSDRDAKVIKWVGLVLWESVERNMRFVNRSSYLPPVDFPCVDAAFGLEN
ncbi:uncharacterized protein G2W53_032367 [Senna tora]|uniref:Uncharacterized protein n=1 Tax=Senna tora TaxID=362788 RepID=A0A834SX84_9FABA|nr:uncharacterized protein G2W53_032367 [Senna tora]